MMIWKLDDKSTSQLLELPETGMGFQLVEGEFEGETRLLMISYGSSVLDLTELELSSSREPQAILNNGLIVTKALSDLEKPLSKSPIPKNFQLKGSRIRTANMASFQQQLGIALPPRIAAQSTLVKKVTLSAPRVFYRFSAYSNDKRINSNTGDFLSGTYATTNTDHTMVPSGLAAVGRYALPNNQPASYCHEIEAGVGTIVYYGTVAPAFGQAGGGVEAVFPNGAVNIRSKTGPVRVPDE